MSLSGTIRRGMNARRDDQQQGLDYLMGADRVPSQLIPQAQTTMGGLAGIQMQPENTTAGDLLGNVDIRNRKRVLKHSNLKSVLGDLLSGKYDEGSSIEDIYNDIGMGGKYRKGIEGSESLRNVLEDLMAGEYNQETQTPQDIQQQQIDMAKNSPLYSAIMGGQQEGNEAIMRNASMTGGLRSGNVQDAFMDYNTQLSNKALLESYNQQLGALQNTMGLPSQTANIANQYNTMGSGMYEGWVDSGLAREATRGPSTMQTIGGVGGTLLGGAFGAYTGDIAGGAEMGGQAGSQLGGLF